jgi:hypothetical protein
MKTYLIGTSENKEMNIDKKQYLKLKIGDTVTLPVTAMDCTGYSSNSSSS